MSFFKDVKEELNDAQMEQISDADAGDSMSPASEKEEVEEMPACDSNTAECTSNEEEITTNSTTVEGDTTIIQFGTVVEGVIKSNKSVDIRGTVNGDVFCKGKLSISGTINGNIQATELFVNTDRIAGDLSCNGCVKIGKGTVVIGNITGTSAAIAGSVKGDLDIRGPVLLDSTAVVKGNIKAQSVQMNAGAVIEGHCSLLYSQQNLEAIFSL